MLDKFRRERVDHFYGACFIQNHVMVVMESAPCGPLVDCIKKRREPDDRIKTKLMLDAVRGLEYLHVNEFLHTDIKRDNVLVFSLDGVVDVFGKLTDFGSSRNINLLMTNMTFTKGVGTPTYMAPEILNKEKYKNAADVFLFGVMLYECFQWARRTGRRSSSIPGTLCHSSTLENAKPDLLVCETMPRSACRSAPSPALVSPSEF